MAVKNRKKPVSRLRYFYLNGDLHRSLQINKTDDILIAWNFVEDKRVAYNYSDVQKNKKHAYIISQVGEIINRHEDTIKRHLRSGDIEKPQQSHSQIGRAHV